MRIIVMMWGLCLAFAVKAQTYEWSSLPFGGAGFVSGLITCPQEEGLMYARTDVGGAYRWNPSEESWIPLMDFLPESEAGLYGVESLAIDPSSPNRLFLYCGTSYFSNGLSAILYSEDYGESFTKIATVTDLFPAHGNDYGRQSGERLAVCPQNGDFLLCGSRTRGLWKTSDGGNMWQRVGAATFVNDRKLSFVQFLDSARVVAGLLNKGQNNLFLSQDGGTTWTALSGQRTYYMPNRCSMSPDGKTLYVAYSDGEGPSTGGTGALMKCDMTTGSWTEISPQKVSFGDVSVSRDNPKYLMAVSMGIWWGQYWAAGSTTWGDQIWISRNGGDTWTNLMESGRSTYSEGKVKWMKESCQLHWCGSAQMDPFDSSRAYFASGNGIVSTANLWSAKPTFGMCVTGLEETVPLSIMSVKGAPLAVTLGDYDGCIYPDVSEYQERFYPSMGTTATIAVAGNNPNVMMRGANALYYSSDMGKTWVQKNMPVGSTGISHCTVSADGTVLIVTPSGMKPYYSKDNGQTWTMLSVAPSGMEIFADPVNNNAFYGMDGNTFNVYMYNETTGVFTTKQKTVNGVAGRICVVGGQAGEVWLPRGTDGLVRLTKCDVSTPRMKNIAVSQCTCIGVGKSLEDDGYPTLYMWGRGTSDQPIGIYRSDDAGIQWIRINDDQHQFGGPGNGQFVSGDMNEYGRVYMSSVGRGVVTGKLIDSNPNEVVEVMQDDRVPVGEEESYVVYGIDGRKVYQGKTGFPGDMSRIFSSGIYILRNNGKSVKVKI